MPKARKSKKSKVEEKEVFSVEKILDKMVKDGKTFYLLKWFNFDDSENTWEPEENLSCPALIESFERQYAEKQKALSSSGSSKEAAAGSNSVGGGSKAKKSKKASTASDPVVNQSPLKKSKIEPELPLEDEVSNGGDDDQDVRMPGESGFAKGWIAEDILGATEESGQVLFLIKWKDISQPELVYSTEANTAIPQMVIKFYESKLTWHDDKAAAES